MGSDSKHSSYEVKVEEDPMAVERAEVEIATFEKRTMRLVDWRMLPLLGGIYAMALIDRTNIGIARTAGLALDLDLTVGSRYSIILCVYFIPYIVLQLPSNLALRKLGVRMWISFCVLAWGASQVGMGFVKNWQVLAFVRALLGLFEAGYFPAMTFVITTWYKRHEVQTRLAVFYQLSVFIAGFSPIFAYALTFLAGRDGLNAWSWIFIVEGIITMALGLLAFFFIPNFPDQNNFLSKEQTALVLDRIERDRGDSIPDIITRQKVFHHLSDWTTWAYALMFMSGTLPAYAISYFITTLLMGMGFNVRDSLLLSAPPFVFSAFFATGVAYLSDKTRLRAPWIIFQALVTVIGLLMTAYSPHNGVRYAGLYFGNAGAAGSVPAILAYCANNVVSHSKRAVSTAVIVAFGGVGGIFATTAFREQDAPNYLPGIWATIGCQFLMITLASLLACTYHRRNKMARETGTVLEGQPGFFYTL